MNNKTNKLLENLFFKMLPVQILIFAMGSVNSIVDGTVAGRFIDSSALGVVGLYYSMVNVLSAVGSVLLGGTAVLCGKYIGRGDHERTEGIFSLNLTLTFIIGAVITILSFVFPGGIALILGANESLMESLKIYIVGYAIGILPMLLAQQIASFLQLERQDMRGYAGVAGMIISNVALDILFVVVFRMGIWGLALATSLSNIVYFLILAPYYLMPKAQLHYHVKKILWSDAIPLIKTGFPGALLVFCLALRGIVINRILLRYEGGDGLSAMSAFSMVSGIFIAYCLANGAVVRMLVSVFVGEEDKTSIKQVIKIVFTKGLFLSCVVAAVICALSHTLTGIFFPDRMSNVYILTYKLFVIYSLCIPLILICQVFTNFLQAMGHSMFVNIQSIFDGFFSMVLPAMILAPYMGAEGVWYANPIGIVLTILTVPVYNVIYWKRVPRVLDEYLFFRPEFGAKAENVLAITIQRLAEVAPASEKVQQFCADHNMGKKTSYFSALCLEEMAGNVVEHGFTHDKKKHSINIRIVYMEDRIVLRLRDDCIPFDPGEMAAMVSENAESGNIGIRMVYDIADEISYRNMLGLNVLTITIKEENLAAAESTDYLLEKTLRKLNPDLHAKFRETVFAAQSILSRYTLLFPGFTDHSDLHSMTVIDSCNRLIGTEQVSRLNADELYVILMGAYLHDVGMGISEKDYSEFKDRLGEKEYFEENPGRTRENFVRDRHNEFSGFFIEKYAELFDIPSPEHVFAIKQIARGHRKTELMDENEYPSEYMLPNGNKVCLPYLAALIRIADEIDVAASRNPIILYDIELLTDVKNLEENKKLQAIRSLRMTKDSFVLTAETDEEAVYDSLKKMTDKMQKVLDYCREVIEKRTPYTLTQKKVVLIARDTADVS